MAEILPGVHTIDGIGPSPEFTTNVLLLKNTKGGTWTLLDTGLPSGDGYQGGAAIVQAYCQKQKIPLSSITSILITHLHRDHVGDLTAIAKATGAKTYAHWLEAAFIANDPPYVGPGTPPKVPFQVSDKLQDGDKLDLYEGLVAVASPGHTPGHLAYYNPSRKILFAGDAFFNSGGLALTPPEYTFSKEMALISGRRLSELEVESLVQYHGSPVLQGAKAELQKAVRAHSK